MNPLALNAEIQAWCDGDELVVGTLVGWRAWSVDRQGWLRGALHHRWQPGENVAECRPARWWHVLLATTPPVSGAHAAPADGCKCGIYAFHAPAGLAWHGVDRYAPLVVVGAVEMSGRVIVGERGCKAERGRILGLSVARRLDGTRRRLELAQERYGDVAWYGNPMTLAAALPARAVE